MRGIRKQNAGLQRLGQLGEQAARAYGWRSGSSYDIAVIKGALSSEIKNDSTVVRSAEPFSRLAQVGWTQGIQVSLAKHGPTPIL